MKKINSILMAAALMAGSLASCTVNDEIDTQSSQLTPSNKEIKFTTGITRATPSTTANLTAFDVYAFNHSDNSTYIDGISFTGTTAAGFTGATTCYWPESGSLDFYAIAPGKSAITTTDSGEGITGTDKKFSYTASETNGSQVDLMIANNLTEQAKPGDGASNPSLTFNHLLSQIVFKGYVESTAGLTVKIKSVTIYNVQNKGSWDAGTLTSGGEKKNYAVGLSYDSGNDYVTLGTTAADITAADGALMLIPQQLTAWKATGDDKVTISVNDSGDKNAYIAIELTAQNGDDYVVGSKTGDDITYKTVYFPLATPAAGAIDASDDAGWLAGKRYVYTLHFGADTSSTGGTEDGLGYGDDGTAEEISATAITLTATVTDWEDRNQTIDF